MTKWMYVHNDDNGDYVVKINGSKTAKILKEAEDFPNYQPIWFVLFDEEREERIREFMENKVMRKDYFGFWLDVDKNTVLEHVSFGRDRILFQKEV